MYAKLIMWLPFYKKNVGRVYDAEFNVEHLEIISIERWPKNTTVICFTDNFGSIEEHHLMCSDLKHQNLVDRFRSKIIKIQPTES